MVLAASGRHIFIPLPLPLPLPLARPIFRVCVFSLALSLFPSFSLTLCLSPSLPLSPSLSLSLPLSIFLSRSLPRRLGWTQLLVARRKIITVRSHLQEGADVWVQMYGCRCMGVDVWLSCTGHDVWVQMYGCRCMGADVWV